jgi:hypothetical protein
MKALCSWCQAEGVPAYLGEREPVDNPGETFGVCPRHMVEVLTAPRSRPSTSVQLLIVVALGDRSLHEYLCRRLATIEGVKVLLERRQSERRSERRPVSLERRQTERRQQRSTAQFMGCSFVRIGSVNNVIL